MLCLRPIFVALLLISATIFGAKAEPVVPPLRGSVMDLANILTPSSETELTRKLEDVRTRTGAQIVVVTVPDLGPYSIETWGITLGRGWKIGRAGKDDGVLIIVAPNDREVRIEVGYGLEGDIPDARAHKIITGVLLPAFRNGNYSGGLGRAVDALEKLITDPNATIPEHSSHGGLYIVLLFVAGIFGMMAIGVFASSRSWNSTRPTGSRSDRDDNEPSSWTSSSDSFSSSSGYSSYSGGGGSFGGGGASGKW